MDGLTVGQRAMLRGLAERGMSRLFALLLTLRQTPPREWTMLDTIQQASILDGLPTEHLDAWAHIGFIRTAYEIRRLPETTERVPS